MITPPDVRSIAEEEEVLALSRRMRDGARNGEWGVVGAAEAERRALLARLLDQVGAESAGGARGARAISALIGSVLEFDRETVELAQQRRNELMRGLTALREGKRMCQAYRGVGE